jgi:hypothetical protein
MLSSRTAFLIFSLLLLVGLGSACSRRTTTADLDQLLRAHVPVGSHHTRVVAVLDSLNVEHSGYPNDAGEMAAIWRRTSVRLLDESSIQARFYFDARGNLIRYVLEEQITAV